LFRNINKLDEEILEPSMPIKWSQTSIYWGRLPSKSRDTEVISQHTH